MLYPRQNERVRLPPHFQCNSTEVHRELDVHIIMDKLGRPQNRFDSQRFLKRLSFHGPLHPTVRIVVEGWFDERR